MSEPTDAIHFSRDVVVPGERAAFFRRVHAGELTGIHRGIFVETAVWASLRADQRHRILVQAAARYCPDAVTVCHHSAAAMWRLPSIERWPDRVQTIVGAAGGGRSTRLFRRHAVGVPSDTVAIDGLRVTSLVRTVVDVAASTSFAAAVVIADAALRRTDHAVDGVPRSSVTRTDLLDAAELIPAGQGGAKARRSLAFADGRADRPGESLSRVAMALAGIPAPDLQVEVFGASGARYFADFGWMELNLLGEFDGHGKYSLPEFLKGRTPQQALIDEKRREDDLRAAGYRVVRWEWETARSPERLATHLRRAGL
jgi:hypothetical protein